MKFFSDTFIFPTLPNFYLLSLLTQVSHIYQVPLPYKTLCQDVSFLLTQPSPIKLCLFLLINEKINSERQHKTAYLVITSLQMGELGFELDLSGSFLHSHIQQILYQAPIYHWPAVVLGPEETTLNQMNSLSL